MAGLYLHVPFCKQKCTYCDFASFPKEIGKAESYFACLYSLGRELVAFAQNEAKTCGKGGILLTTHVANVRAQALYEAMGFVCMGQCKNGTELFYLYRYRE